MVTMHVPYDAKPNTKQSKLFASAKRAPLFEEIVVSVKKEKEEVCFLIEIPEDGKYQFHKIEARRSLGYGLYNEKFIRIGGGNNFTQALLAGKYYLIVDMFRAIAGDTYSFIITQEGEIGYDEGPNTLLVDKVKRAISSLLKNKSLHLNRFCTTQLLVLLYFLTNL